MKWGAESTKADSLIQQRSQALTDKQDEHTGWDVGRGGQKKKKKIAWQNSGINISEGGAVSFTLLQS